MKLKILDKKEEELLSRISIKARIIFDKATPSNQEIKKQIASELKADETLVVVKKVSTEYGKTEADIDAYIYRAKEEMQKIEPRKKKKAAKPGEKTAEGAAPQPAESPQK